VVKYLLDTHALIWSQDDPSRFPSTASAILTNPSHDRVVSVATLWEIGIKVALGKLKLAKPLREWVLTAKIDLVLVGCPISLHHIEQQIQLPFHHRDPFDRLLAAQSLTEQWPLISADTVFDPYGVTRIWS
jgi:PIN domain nuclease of toxin-antitoxin system